MRMIKALAWAGAVMAAPAHSAVTSSGEKGFVVENSVEIAAAPGAVYEMLGRPALWWSGEHSYGGSAAKLTLDPVAGGCFCESLPAGGGVEHGRVLYAAPGKKLRISGALGPLQSEAVTGILTFDIEPTANGARVALSYVVGGYMRMDAAKLAPGVDKVLAEQLQGLRRAAEDGGNRRKR
ncbi:polyketide cyclase [Sphingobium bisphenolivorans]|uniref:polyketide cyclase n=1 Tax=Sphingobium bisphenolivorans TaxID=1335760 RepID=UPI0003A8027E|nr:polyketide cyclase [Sphingobium bisphenolivorans]